MDWGYVVEGIYEFAYLLGVFGIFFFIAIWKGRQAIINLIMGLYLALLISIEFPYYDKLLGDPDSGSSSVVKLAFFAAITLLATWLFWRIMPDEFRERKFESFFKKILLTSAATVLMMVFSFQVLPVTEFLTPGTPIQSLFGPTEYFFWWLLVPLVVLFVV